MVSPDVGNVKVANMYADVLGCDLAIVDKRRQSGTEVAVNLIGDVEGRTVLMFDDMISTAGTSARPPSCHGTGRRTSWSPPIRSSSAAMQRLADGPISTVNITDTIPGGSRLETLGDKVKVLGVARLLGEAIHRIHHDQSVSAMFRTGAGTKR